MKRLPTLTLIAAAFFVSLCTIARPQSPAAYDDPDAFAVYSALLGRDDGSKPGKKRHIVINDITADYPTSSGERKFACLVAPKGREAELEPVFSSYRKANAEPVRLAGKLDLPFEYEFVSPDLIDGLFKTKGVNGWKDFYTRYPDSGGYNELSAVGFNADRSLALVYAGNSCGSLCGFGTYYLFEKRNGKWVRNKGFGTCSWAS